MPLRCFSLRITHYALRRYAVTLFTNTHREQCLYVALSADIGKRGLWPVCVSLSLKSSLLCPVFTTL